MLKNSMPNATKVSLANNNMAVGFLAQLQDAFNMMKQDTAQ
jgi:hypothetical protein